MNNVKSVSWIRMVLAFAAVLLIGGSGLVLAASPGATYVPTASILLGSSTVPHSSANNQYRLQVTFGTNGTFTFPTDTPAPGATLSFAAVKGTITPAGVYTAPATGAKDRITATYTQNGTSVVSSLTINLAP